jgi:hypothetical protein
MAQTREDAVAAARAGRLEESIAALRSLISAGDSSPETAYDLAVILTWAKRPQEATEVFEHTETEGDVPEYVLLAMTRAYWDQQRYEEAKRLARRGSAEFPTNQDWTKLDALISGEAADRAGDSYSALREYAEARQSLPDDVDLRNAEAGVLARMGAPYAAAQMRDQPDPGLEAREAGLMVRWGARYRSADPRLRFAGTDAAMARLDFLIAAAEAARPRDSGLLTRLRRDRVVALRDRERWTEAVAQAEQLARAGDRLPPYVLQAEADSLLALRHPKAARRAYQEVLKAEPRNRDASIGLFYAEVETEHFWTAFATIDALGDRVTAAMARNYADMNAEAWRRLYPLSQTAPALGYLRSSVGTVAAARGWPRLADEEVKIAASLAPQDLGIRIALADSALRLRRYREAINRSRELASVYAGNASVQRLVRDVESFDSFEFRSESYRYKEGVGGGPNAPGSGFGTVNRIYSRPLADRFRIVCGIDDWEAQPIEGRVDRWHVGCGLEWRLPSLTFEATGWDNLGTLHRGGAHLAVTWTPTDHWSFAADAQLFTTDMPLRALLYGITANSLVFGAGYEWHESRGWGGNVQVVDFSDGNHRLAGGFHFVQRFVDRPHLKVTVRPELYTSRNTLLNAPYFNPPHDFSAFLSLDAVHTMWRRYEKAFRQHISGGAGSYWEQDDGTHAIFTAAYEQILEFSPATYLHYGATFARRSYDGDLVNSVTLSLGITRRF